MVAIDFSNCVGGSVREEVVEELYLRLPFSVRTQLSLGKHEGLARVEETINGREAGVLTSNFKDSRKSEEVEGGSACLQDQTVRGHEE